MKITIEGHETEVINKLADKIGWILNGAGDDEPNFSVKYSNGSVRPNAYNKGQALIVVKHTKGSDHAD
jgi:hypothetical protein